MASYKISPATEADVPELLSLILDLAVYEKEPDAVVATPELMIENVFRKKYAECLIARKETSDGSKGEAVGLALGGLIHDLKLFSIIY
ncbi:hypothetical protein EHS25_008101 [Saitozyma podzolica]|uniref:N-acetyltransferase domain-containing protein n=1 Tax=Saitozyma podzolica TaxID=1890683 RepID=A0A427YNL5_9TREE|nr:hypothetical protein EHS25_008101 [Saitozyma podzolica]